MNKQQFNAMVAQYGTKTVISDGNHVVDWSGGAHCYLPSLKFYGACQQNAVPTPDAPVDIWDCIGVYRYMPGDKYIYLPNLRGVGSYRDEWDYVTGKGLRYIHKVELDGVSEYGKVTSYTHSSGARAAWVEQTEFTPKNAVLSTHFKNKHDISVPGNIYANGGRIYLSFDNALFVNTKAINDWLAVQKEAGTPVTVYYAMAEPIPFEGRYESDVYQPIPNDGGQIEFIDGPIYEKLSPFELTYITHS